MEGLTGASKDSKRGTRRVSQKGKSEQDQAEELTRAQRGDPYQEGEVLYLSVRARGFLQSKHLMGKRDFYFAHEIDEELNVRGRIFHSSVLSHLYFSGYFDREQRSFTGNFPDYMEEENKKRRRTQLYGYRWRVNKEEEDRIKVAIERSFEEVFKESKSDGDKLIHLLSWLYFHPDQFYSGKEIVKEMRLHYAIRVKDSFSNSLTTLHERTFLEREEPAKKPYRYKIREDVRELMVEHESRMMGILEEHKNAHPPTGYVDKSQKQELFPFSEGSSTDKPVSFQEVPDPTISSHQANVPKAAVSSVPSSFSLSGKFHQFHQKGPARETPPRIVSSSSASRLRPVRDERKGRTAQEDYDLWTKCSSQYDEEIKQKEKGLSALKLVLSVGKVKKEAQDKAKRLAEMDEEELKTAQLVLEKLRSGELPEEYCLGIVERKEEGYEAMQAVLDQFHKKEETSDTEPKHQEQARVDFVGAKHKRKSDAM